MGKLSKRFFCVLVLICLANPGSLAWAGSEVPLTGGSGPLEISALLNQTQFQGGDELVLTVHIQGGVPPFDLETQIEMQAGTASHEIMDWFSISARDISKGGSFSCLIDGNEHWYDGLRDLEVSVTDAMEAKDTFYFKDIQFGTGVYVKTFKADKYTATVGEPVNFTVTASDDAAAARFHFSIYHAGENRQIVSQSKVQDIAFETPGIHFVQVAVEDRSGSMKRCEEYEKIKITVAPAGIEAPGKISGFDGGSGTQEDPYRITTAQQLIYFAEKANGGAYFEGQEYLSENRYSFKGEYIVLENDIVLNAPGKKTGKWYPIYDFEGVLDGQGHTISGLFLHQDSGDMYYIRQGDIPSQEIAFIGNNRGVIRNLTLSGVIMDVTYNGGDGFAPFAVSNDEGALIENCVSLMTAIIDIKENGIDSLAGIVLENGGIVRGCSNRGTLINNRIVHNDSAEEQYYLDYPNVFYLGVVRSELWTYREESIGIVVDCADESLIYGHPTPLDLIEHETPIHLENYTDNRRYETVTREHGIKLIAQALAAIGMEDKHPTISIAGLWEAIDIPQNNPLTSLVLDLRSDGEKGMMTTHLSGTVSSVEISYYFREGGFLCFTGQDGGEITFDYLIPKSHREMYDYARQGDTLTLTDTFDSIAGTFRLVGEEKEIIQADDKNSQILKAWVASPNGLNLRQKASSDSASLAILNDGTEVIVTDKGKEWSAVNWNGKTGYMATSFLTFSDPAREDSLRFPVMGERTAGVPVKGAKPLIGIWTGNLSRLGMNASIVLELKEDGFGQISAQLISPTDGTKDSAVQRDIQFYFSRNMIMFLSTSPKVSPSEPISWIFNSIEGGTFRYALRNNALFIFMLFPEYEFVLTSQDEGWMWPVPGSLIITSPYNVGNSELQAIREKGVGAKDAEHRGIDIANNDEGLVVATREGVVTRAQNTDKGSGCYIFIEHEWNGTKYYSSYWHLKEGSLKVDVGTKDKPVQVKQGDPIAIMGKTGKTDAVHLHFMISTDQTWATMNENVNYKTTAINVNPYDTHLIKNSGAGANYTLDQISAEANGQVGLPYWTDTSDDNWNLCCERDIPISLLHPS